MMGLKKDGNKAEMKDQEKGYPTSAVYFADGG